MTPEVKIFPAPKLGSLDKPKGPTVREFLEKALKTRDALAKNLPSSLRKYREVEPGEPEPPVSHEPEPPLCYEEVLTRAVVNPLRLGHHVVRDERGKSFPVEIRRGKILKRPLPRRLPVAVLTDMRDPDVHDEDTIRLSAPFADWTGGIPVNTTLRHPDMSSRLKRDIRNRRRSSRRIIT